MQNAGLRAAGLLDWHYVRLALPPERFADAVRSLHRSGYRGLNVTIPHKEAALAVADEATDAAAAIGAANTLTFGPGRRIHADNTDAPGLIDALPLDPEGRRALVLGAGGSARAVVYALVRAGAADVQVWNRTAERAQRLAAELGARAVTAPEPAELIVNCTSIGLDDPSETFDVLPITTGDFGPGTCVVDLVYRDGGTALIRAANDGGATTVDGLAVLLGQGAASFERWTGRPAPREAMAAAL
jgi:shikimate dehydrogenase